MDEIPGEHLPPLNTFNKEEWFEIGLECNPRLTREEFERLWAEFWDNRRQRELN